MAHFLQLTLTPPRAPWYRSFRSCWIHCLRTTGWHDPHRRTESLTNVSNRQRIEKGQILAKIGTPEEHGGWPSHLHFQIIADLFEQNENFPGVAAASERQIWKNLCPDPNLLLGIPPDRFPGEMTAAETLSERHRFLGQNLSISYRNPLKIVRGWRQYVYDDTGRAYLDAYNNVPLVGHSHPRVVRAIRDQAEKLYVQHRMMEQANQLWEWLDNGAHFYVCGDASRMAKDVDNCLHKIIESVGGKTPEQARTFVMELKNQKRYQRDVY